MSNGIIFNQGTVDYILSKTIYYNETTQSTTGFYELSSKEKTIVIEGTVRYIRKRMVYCVNYYEGVATWLFLEGNVENPEMIQWVEDLTNHVIGSNI